MFSIRRLCASLAAVGVAGSLGCLGTAGTAAADPSAVVDPNASVAYQHDPAHDGDSMDTSFVAPFTTAWSKTLGGTVGYPLIADGRVFVTVSHDERPGNGYGDDVEALSLATGEALWGPTSIDGTYSAASIAYDGGQVFAINGDGRLTAFDAATGAVNWTTQLAGQYSFTSPPTAVDGTVYVPGAGTGGTLYAVDEGSGSITWTQGTHGGAHSSPAVDGTGVVVSYGCEQAYKFDLAGSLIWHHDTGCVGGGGSTPVLHDGKVYIRDVFGKPPAVLDVATGTDTGAFAAGPVPAFDGRRTATVSNGVLTVSDTSSGDPVWHTTAGDAVTAPMFANGYVIEGLRDGTVEARLAQNGDLVWSGQASAVLEAPDERNSDILTGSAEGDGALVVPAGSTIAAFTPAGDTAMDLTSGPAADAFVGPAATFGFTSAVVNARYMCTLDGDSKPCTSPVHLSHLTHGTHRFSVSVAYANSGAATRTFRVDTTAPVARVAPFRSLLIRGDTASAHWSAADPDSGVVEYQARSRQAHIGTSFRPWWVHRTTSATSASLHLVHDAKLCASVRAKDRVGNWSAWSPAQCVRRR